MTYIDLQNIKEGVKAFRTDKCVYDDGDVLSRMRDKIFEEMAIIGYSYLDKKAKTVEELFAERIRVLLSTQNKKDFEGEQYIRLVDVNQALKTLALKSLHE